MLLLSSLSLLVLFSIPARDCVTHWGGDIFPLQLIQSEGTLLLLACPEAHLSGDLRFWQVGTRNQH